MALRKRPELYFTGNIIMSKEKKIQWAEHVEKVDPGYRSKPVVTYMFGKRTFYKPKRPSNGIRKG